MWNFGPARQCGAIYQSRLAVSTQKPGTDHHFSSRHVLTLRPIRKIVVCPRFLSKKNGGLSPVSPRVNEEPRAFSASRARCRAERGRRRARPDRKSVV